MLAQPQKTGSMGGAAAQSDSPRVTNGERVAMGETLSELPGIVKVPTLGATRALAANWLNPTCATMSWATSNMRVLAQNCLT